MHFHNTFFYNKLFADNSEYNYKAVQRYVPLCHARAHALFCLAARRPPRLTATCRGVRAAGGRL